MPISLFLIFNHNITPVQESDAHNSLDVQQIINMPPDFKELWRQIPPTSPKISAYLSPVKNWLAGHARKNDYVSSDHDFMRFLFYF
jgi:energy-converting hydrogenase Eha subunit F